ncbi:hypothetical protein BS630_30745 [Rhizobium laguerreae]|nr:hypothetical protein BS630_30745 [Rhizobium laguerreae]
MCFLREEGAKVVVLKNVTPPERNVDDSAFTTRFGEPPSENAPDFLEVHCTMVSMVRPELVPRDRHTSTHADQTRSQKMRLAWRDRFWLKADG